MKFAGGHQGEVQGQTLATPLATWLQQAEAQSALQTSLVRVGTEMQAPSQDFRTKGRLGRRLAPKTTYLSREECRPGLEAP